MKSYCVFLSIAGLPIALHIQSKSMLGMIRRRYRGYVRKAETPLLRLKCSFVRKVFQKRNRVVVDYKKDAGWQVCRRDFECSWQSDMGTAHLYPSVYAIDSLLRVVLSILALENDKLLLHAAAVVCNAKAYVLAGPSGSGKTTSARLVGIRSTLNDEIVCLDAVKRNCVMVYGTPFWGEMGTGPARVIPVHAGAILFLRKSRHVTEVKKVDSIMAIQKLLRCICVFGESTRLSGMALATVIHVAGKVAFGELVFQKDARKVRYVLDHLNRNISKRLELVS